MLRSPLFVCLCWLSLLLVCDARRKRQTMDESTGSITSASQGSTPAANVVMTPSGTAIAADGVSNYLILARLESDGSVSSGRSGASSVAFADLSIDPASNGNLVFALSTTGDRVCSFAFSSGTDLNIVNCVGGSFSVDPFCGVGAFDGTLVISGGTGGVTVYEYNSDGRISSTPLISNQLLDGVIGHPDVAMISANTFALSTDSSQFFDSRFGTQIASVVGGSVTFGFAYNVPDTLFFTEIVRPANFPLVNAFYNNSGSTFMYTANGPMQIQNLARAELIALETPVNEFLALTVAVNQEQKKAIFGGILGVGGNGAVLVYDLSKDPVNPTLESVRQIDQMPGFVGERVTSIATAGNSVAVVNGEGLFAGAGITIIPLRV